MESEEEQQYFVLKGGERQASLLKWNYPTLPLHRAYLHPKSPPPQRESVSFTGNPKIQKPKFKNEWQSNLKIKTENWIVFWNQSPNKKQIAESAWSQWEECWFHSWHWNILRSFFFWPYSYLFEANTTKAKTTLQFIYTYSHLFT